MSNKERALNFLQAIVKGNIDLAYKKFVDNNGTHHNIHFMAGFDALKMAMKENHEKFPNKKFEVILATAEKDLVALFTKVTIENDQYSIVHFFKFKEGKIVEMWDTAQQIPDEIINTDGAF